MGIVFSRFLQVDVNTGVIVGMFIVFVYAVLGGMKGITYTQVAQYTVMIIAYLIPAIFLSLMVTDTFLPQLGIFSTTTFDLMMEYAQFPCWETYLNARLRPITFVRT